MSGHVFICYAREDEEFALQLAGMLKAKAVSVWVDQWDIPPGANWVKSIQRALDECSKCLLVLSPDSVDSDEVMSEWGAVLNKKKPIVPVLYRECDVPYRLLQTQWIRFVGITLDNEEARARLLSVLGGSAPPSRPAPPRRPPPAPKPKPATAAPPTKVAAPKAAPPGAAQAHVVGRVTHYYDRLGVVTVQLQKAIRTGQILRVRGAHTDFLQPVESMQIDRKKIAAAPAGAEIGLKLNQPARPGDLLLEPALPPAPEVPGAKAIGLVIRYYDRIGVAGVNLRNTISVGDRLAFKGSSTNFVQQASSIELNRVKVRTAAAGQEVGLKVDQPVEVGDQIFKL